MKVTKSDGQPGTGVVALMTYFGKTGGQSLQEFNTEVKALTPESKDELVRGACRELGWTVVED